MNDSSGTPTHVPTLLALVLCEQVIEDARTGNKSLIARRRFTIVAMEPPPESN